MSKKSKINFSKDLDSRFLERLKDELLEVFRGCRRIAIKLHMGEPGNIYALTPEQIRPFTEILKDIGIKYFIYDSPVIYGGTRSKEKSYRNYALQTGWGELGEVITKDNSTKIKGKHMDYEVCKHLINADGVLVISHFKGHVCSGFGGAIKNIGMGALSKKTKWNIHAGGEPLIVGTCIACGECEKACPLNTLKVDTKPHIGTCYGCSDCIIACKHSVLRPKVELFDTLLAEGASIAQSNFKKYYFINILKNITKLCDCESNPGNIISDDLGYVSGTDGVAADMASRDTVIDKAGDIFLKFNKKSGTEQIKAAESFGMGSAKYELVS